MKMLEYVAGPGTEVFVNLHTQMLEIASIGMKEDKSVLVLSFTGRYSAGSNAVQFSFMGDQIAWEVLDALTDFMMPGNPEKIFQIPGDYESADVSKELHG